MKSEERTLIRIVYNPYTVNNEVVAVCVTSPRNSRKIGQIDWQQIITDRDVLVAAQPYVACQCNDWRHGWAVVTLDPTLTNRFQRLVRAIVDHEKTKSPREVKDAAD